MSSKGDDSVDMSTLDRKQEGFGCCSLAAPLCYPRVWRRVRLPRDSRGRSEG